MSGEQHLEGVAVCQECGTPLQGKSILCVLCFWKAHQPCPVCMRRLLSGRYVPWTAPDTGKPMNCERCGNERWVLIRDKE